MDLSFEAAPFEKTPLFARRYEAVERANSNSFYLNDPHRRFDIYQSMNSFGETRATDTPVYSVLWRQEFGVAAGNMSPFYGPGDDEVRRQRAGDNLRRFMEPLGIPDNKKPYVLRPYRKYDRPLQSVNLDNEEVLDNGIPWHDVKEAADFIYTYDPEKIIGVRPADCPVLFFSGNTPDGWVYGLCHYAWQGAAVGYIAQTGDIFDGLGVDRTTLQLYLSPGAHSENFPYPFYDVDPREKYPGTHELFRNIETYNDPRSGEVRYRFTIDTPYFAYHEVIDKLGVQPSQVFCDTSDTARLDSGFSSHSRWFNLDQAHLPEENSRDIIFAVPNKNISAL